MHACSSRAKTTVNTRQYGSLAACHLMMHTTKMKLLGNGTCRSMHPCMHYCLSKFCQQIIYGKSRIITLSVVSTLEFQGTRPLLCSQQVLNTSSSDGGLQVKIVEINFKSEIQVNSCSIINLKIARKRDFGLC